MTSRTLRTTFAFLALLLLAGAAPAAGLLVPRDGSAPIHVQNHRVTADLEDGMARTTVRQTFVNPHGRALEAVYVFPLPEGSALVHVAMETAGKRYEGLLVERKEARRVYDSIVRRREDPALVEQIGRNKFRLSVFPVLPGQPTVVEITYTQPVPLAKAKYRYVYPLALGGKAVAVEQDFTVLVRIRSSAGLTAVTSPTPGMAISRPGKNAAIASMERTKARLERDVVVEATVKVGEPTIAVSTFKEKGRPGVFMAVVTPPSVAKDEVVPRDVILVMDTSGSMRGVKIHQAKESAEYLVENLRPVDRVGILLFNSSVRSLTEGLVLATKDRKAALRKSIRDVVASGSTALGGALQRATALGLKSEKGRARTVVLLTDGLPTVGVTDPAAIVAFAKKGADRGLRVYPFGVGSDVDSGLLRGIARAGRGAAEIFRPGGEIAGRLRRFLDRTASPVLSNLEITVDGVETYDVFPRPLPDVYLGEQIVVTGRYRRGGEGVVVAKAAYGDGSTTIAVGASFREEPGGPITARDTFGRQKLDFLEETLRIRQGLSDEAYYEALDRGRYETGGEIVKEIVDVSLETGIQCGYTSFLVLLPEDRARVDPRNMAEVRSAQERIRNARRNRLGELAAGDPSLEGLDEAFEEDVDLAEDEPDDLNSDVPFDGPSPNSAIGVGGGAGGTFSGRGKRVNLRAEGGGGTQWAVDLGLEWLKINQHPDGYWEGDGNTALSLLTFLGAGETHKTGRYRNTVKLAAKHLKQIQDPEGCFGSRERPDFLTHHALATLAMCELYGLTGSPLFQHSSQRGIEFLLKAWVEGGGFAATPGGKDADPGVTIWAMLVLRSAKDAGLESAVPSDVLPSAAAWLEGQTAESGRLGQKTAHEDWLTPGAVLARIFAGEAKRPYAGKLAKSVALVASEPPVVPEKGTKYDMRRWYLGTLAMFQVGGPAWKTWNAGMKFAVIDSQRKDGDKRGSWDPDGVRGKQGGRVYATATMAMCLQAYYRYSRVFGVRKR